MKEGKYILFRFLLGVRGLVKLIFNFIWKLMVIMFIGMYFSPKWGWRVEEKLLVSITGLICWFGSIYYDKLLYKIKPDNMDLWLDIK